MDLPSLVTHVCIPLYLEKTRPFYSLAESLSATSTTVYSDCVNSSMGQGHSSAKNAQQQSKYTSRDSSTLPAQGTKQKKRGSGRSSNTKSAHGGKRPAVSGDGVGVVGMKARPVPPPHSERRLPALPPSRSPHQVTPSQSTRTHSSHSSSPRMAAPTKTQTKTLSSSLHHHHHPPTSRGHERSTAPSLPSRQFSLTNKSPSTPTTTGGGGCSSGGGSSSGGGGGSGTSKHAMIEKYFNLYKDRNEDTILAEGMEKFCIDLDVDPTEFIVLVLAWKFEASQMCRFKREEFMNGCQRMKAYDAKSLQGRFPELLRDARGENFKELYHFTFSFGLDHSTGQRSLPIDMAVQLWDLVFTQDKPEILERWFTFLREMDTRGISRDTWNMFLDFCQNVAPDLSDYDESEAWPSLFDDFVEYELSK